MNYEIPGLSIVYKDLDNPPWRTIKYRGFLCKMSIATDMLGTQICYNGRFFDGKSFKDVEEGVEYLRQNKDRAVKFFRPIYFQHIKYLFTLDNLDHQYWRIRNHFDPNFFYDHHVGPRGILRYFLGETQGRMCMPTWVYRITPRYVNNDTYKLGPFTFHFENGYAGETFFMELRRKLGK